jgi:DNA-binding HxlR family transcriptional regulator
MKTPKANCYAKNCPSRLVLERLSDKWTILIICLLKDKPLRFNQLKNSIQGISQKVLTTNLRKLEADGVITRKVIDESVIKVEYSITGLGHELTKIFISVKDWAEKNWKQVGTCNEKFLNKKKV